MDHVDLSPKNLLRSDGTFILQASEFSELGVYVRTMLSSDLAHDTYVACASLKWQTKPDGTRPLEVTHSLDHGSAISTRLMWPQMSNTIELFDTIIKTYSQVCPFGLNERVDH